MIKYALTNKSAVLFKHLSVVGIQKKYYRQALGLDYALNDFIYRKGAMFWNYDGDVEFNRALLRGQSFNESIQHFIISMANAANNLEKIAKSLSRTSKWKSKTKHELEKIFGKYIEYYLLNIPFLMSFWNAENILIPQLRTDFDVLFGSESSEITLFSVLTPSKATYFEKERNSVKTIAEHISRNRKLKELFCSMSENGFVKELKHNPKLSKLFHIHLKEFAFTTAPVLLGEPMKVGGLIDRIRVVLDKKKDAQLGNGKKAKKYIAVIKKYPDVYERYLLGRDLMFWKNQRLDLMFKSDYLMRPLYTEIADRIGLSYLEFVHLTLDEIKQSFRSSGLSVSKEEIQRRIRGYSIWSEKGKIFLTSDKKKFPAVKKEKSVGKNDSQKKDDVLKGTVAQPGKVTGVVRLVFELKDLKKIRKGDVLVTTMTRPEMMIALEKAVAFVTDEGGMLSHAAIVSREMGKPCIIGTKIATEVFKDGDMVEVDANKGIVRKL